MRLERNLQIGIFFLESEHKGVDDNDDHIPPRKNISTEDLKFDACIIIVIRFPFVPFGSIQTFPSSLLL